MAKDVDGRGDAASRRAAAAKDVDGRGGPADLVNDIVGRAAQMGGWLVVSFIAPVPARTISSSRRTAVATAIGEAASTIRAAAKKASSPK
jgi:hypothetical protein